jgi:hypothetical protein
MQRVVELVEAKDSVTLDDLGDDLVLAGVVAQSERGPRPAALSSNIRRIRQGAPRCARLRRRQDEHITRRVDAPRLLSSRESTGPAARGSTQCKYTGEFDSFAGEFRRRVVS